MRFVEEGGSYVAHEAMFSKVYDLASNHQELLLRMHPIKKQSYDSILAGEATVTHEGTKLRIVDVILHLNGVTGIVKVDYRSIADVKITSVKNTIVVSGFDNNGEPIIYEMLDGTIRVVFSALPPAILSPDDNFDLNNFAADFIYATRCGASHDDREVFHVPTPHTTTVPAIKAFLERYR